MARFVIDSFLLIIIVSSNVNCQIFDNFFQDLSPLVKRYHTTRTFTRYVTTNEYTTSKPGTYRQTNKIIYNNNDNYGYDNPRKTAEREKKKDDTIYFTTSKPIRKNYKSSQSTIRRNIEPETIRRISNGNNEDKRDISHDDNYETTKRYNDNIFVYPDENYNNYKTTHRNFVTTKPYLYETTKSNYFTTHNPLVNRPGVKPTIIDDRPPITNRPATKRPSFYTYPRPTDSGTIMFPKDPDVSPEMIKAISEDDMTEAEKRKYVDLSERMCNKYKAMTTKRVAAIPLLPSPDPVSVSGSCAPSTIPLVVGGKVVEIKDFPHMALLGWTKIEDGGYSWKCGGSLISERFVLTAAHCAYQDRDNSVVSGPPRVVQLGSSYLDDPGALVVRVSSYIRHPKYKLPASYYDIALLKLASDVMFSEVIKPACLGVPPHVGEPIIATGWGKTEFAGDQSLELRSVSLPIWSNEECKEVLGTSRRFPSGPSRESQMCAGDRRGGKDTCQGDSGGPAQVQDECLWRVVAVTSLGRSCGAAGTPGLYAIAQRAFIAANVFQDQINNRDEFNRDNERNNRDGNRNSEKNNHNEYTRDKEQNNRNEYNRDNGNDNRNTRDYNQKRNANRPFFANEYSKNGNTEQNNYESENIGYNTDSVRQVGNDNDNTNNDYNKNNNKNIATNTDFIVNHEGYGRDRNLGSIYNVRVDEVNQYNDNKRQRNNEGNVNYYNNDRVYWNR